MEPLRSVLATPRSPVLAGDFPLWFRVVAFHLAIQVAVFVFLISIAEFRPYAAFVSALMCLYAIYGVYRTSVLLFMISTWREVAQDWPDLAAASHRFTLIWYTGWAMLPVTLIIVAVWGYVALRSIL